VPLKERASVDQSDAVAGPSVVVVVDVVVVGVVDPLKHPSSVTEAMTAPAA
jgi:hypothetical protein